MQATGTEYAKGVSQVGYLPNQERPAFKMAVHKHGDRWYLYCAHFWHSGWSITDVTYGCSGSSRLMTTSPASQEM